VHNITNWTPKGEPGHLKKAPEGKLIDSLFTDWIAGKLQGKIDKHLGGEYPDIDAICKELCTDCCGEVCPRQNTRKPQAQQKTVSRVNANKGNRKLSKQDIELRIRVDRENGLEKDTCADEIQLRLLDPLIWKVLSNHARRAIVILAILGDRNMRPGGYHWADLRRVSGVRKNGPTERLIASLTDLGYLTRKQRSRYDYRIVLSHDFGTAKRRETLQRLNEEFSRGYARGLLDVLRKSIPGHPRHRFVEGEHFSWAGPGLLVGDLPPPFAVEIMGEISEAVKASVFDGFSGLVDIGIERRAEGEEAYDTAYDEPELLNLVDQIKQMLKRLNDLSPQQAREWIRYRRDAIEGKLQSGTVLIHDVPDIIRDASM
jgi:hypothetical protein